MKSMKKLLSLLLVLILVFSLEVPALAGEVPVSAGESAGSITVLSSFFSDVSPDDWYYSDVMEVYRLGIMDGMSDTTFEPYTGMTRAMFATVLYRMSGSPAVTGNVSATFTDCADGVWYSDAVLWAYNHGVVSGRGNAIFNPTEIMTRQEMAVMLYNYAIYNGAAEVTMPTLNFADAASIAGWAEAAVSYCHAKGLMTADGNGNFSPNGIAYRAIGAKALKGIHDGMQEPETTNTAFDAYFEANPMDARWNAAVFYGMTTMDTAIIAGECVRQWKAFIETAFESLLVLTTGKEREAIAREYEYYTNNRELELDAIQDEYEPVGGSMDIINSVSITLDFYREKARMVAEWLYRYDTNFWVTLGVE